MDKRAAAEMIGGNYTFKALIHSVVLSMGGFENGQPDQPIVFIVEDDAIIPHFTVVGNGFLLKVNIKRIDLRVIIDP